MPVKVIIYMDYSLYFGVDYFYSPFFSDELRTPNVGYFKEFVSRLLIRARTRPVGIYIVIVGISNSKLAIKIRPAPPNKLPLAVRTSHYECNSNTMPMLH